MEKLKKSKEYRFYEIMPGALVWTVFILAILFSFLRPLWVIYFIIVFDFYWLVRISYFVFYLILSWHKYKQVQKYDWHRKLELEFGQEWNKYLNLVFLPIYTEPVEVIEDTLNGLKNSSYPVKRLWVIVGFEYRDPKHIDKKKYIEEKYSHCFYRFTTTVHKLKGDELAGKGSNGHFMGTEVKRIVDEEGLAYDKLIVSNFDIDTVIHPQYFSYLTHAFLSHPNPYRSSFQPLALYNNNIWSAPSFARVVANSTTFWLMTELARPERMFTFSSHSMSWQALVDVGFWDKTIVTEDSRIFIQCLMRYDGDYEITPMYIPVSMDTVVAGSIWKTIKNQFRQQLRWAYGVEHFPFMLYHFRRNKLIPRSKKVKYLFNLGEGQLSWATAPILIFVLGRLPLYIAGELHDTNVLVQNAPFVLEWLMGIAMIGIAASAFFNLLMVPAQKLKKRRFAPFILLAQWILLPVTLVIFGSFASITAQTKIMLGRYMGFWNTEKSRD